MKDLRERPEAYQAACTRKRIAFSVPDFLTLDEEYRHLKTRSEGLRAEQNRFSKELPSLSAEEKPAKLAAIKELAQQHKDAAAELRPLEERWTALQLQIPSIPLDVVPDGKDDSENVEVSRWGEPSTPSFPLKDHVEIGMALDLFDIERGTKIAGARQYYLKGDGVRLQQAILRLATDLLHEKGFTLFDPPLIVRYQAMMGTGYFPGGEDQAYQLDNRDEGHFLIGTSEVPVCSYHMDEILPDSELPKRYAGVSPCFRREAGTYGKDTHGLYRVHQFTKVEQVILCQADKTLSEKFHYEILGNAEEVMQRLELPYRVVAVCAGDMGLGQVWKHDIETWMPSRKQYSETHSCSSFYDFQARRLGLRYRDDKGTQYCYTLNNTCIASPRVLIPFLEMHQQHDGSVRIPEALQPYFAGAKEIR